MQSKSITRYIEFGGLLETLKRTESNSAVGGENGVGSSFESLCSYIREFEMPVTERAADSLDNIKEMLEQAGARHKLTDSEAKQVREAVESLESTLFAEAGGRVAFIVSDKRLDVNKLLSKVPALMSAQAFAVLPGTAKYDFVEAGKCIAFERPTAAAMHILRALDSLIRQYYVATARKSRVRRITTKRILEGLAKRRNGLPRELVEDIELVLNTFQNPASSIDKIYDIQEVQDLFGQCISIVSRIAPHYPANTEAPETPAKAA